ncbi:MAG: ParB/RepB/Spo0J family partition protein [Acidimicrobiales bacterium]
MTRPLSFNAFLEPPVEVISIPLELIVRDPDQPRKIFDPDSITSLAESIGRFGLLQPVLVGPPRPDGTYMLLSGERRFRAVCELAWETIPAIIRDETAINRTYIQGAENLARKNLGPPEVLSLIERLLQSGETQSAVARGLGVSRQTIGDYAAISRDAVARAALMKGGTFRTVIDALRAREPAAPTPEPSPDLVAPTATVTPIRPEPSGSHGLPRPAPGVPDTAPQPASPSVSPSISPATGTSSTGTSSTSTDRSDDDLSARGREPSGPDDIGRGPSSAGVPPYGDAAGEMSAPTSVEPAPEVAARPPLGDELERHIVELATQSEDPAVLADRAARCLAAGLEVASDLPEPQFTQVIEAHYRKLQRIRDMGSAHP